MNMRNPLCDRENVLSSDVADAIEALVQGYPDLPLPLDKAIVIAQLIRLSHTQEDGTVAPISRMVERALTQSFTSRLTDTTVFSAGYQHYEKRSELPVVPVTDFFFKVILDGSDPTVAECLDAMSDYEIRQSLPKRRSAIRIDEDGDFVRSDDTGDVMHSGSIAGIIVFPANNRSALLRSWLERRANVATGQMSSVVAVLGHARPESSAVEHLREHVETVKPSMRKALPQSKVKRPPPSGGAA